MIGFLDSGVAVDVDDVWAFQRDHPADLLQALFLDGTVVVGEGDAFLFGVGTVLGREIDRTTLTASFCVTPVTASVLVQAYTVPKVPPPRVEAAWRSGHV